jgi:hypothetical protein
MSYLHSYGSILDGNYRLIYYIFYSIFKILKLFFVIFITEYISGLLIFLFRYQVFYIMYLFFLYYTSFIFIVVVDLCQVKYTF